MEGKVENDYRFVVFLACLAVICTQSGISMYSPSIPYLPALLQTGYREVAYTLTAYIFGYAIAMLVMGGVSDQLGRKRAYLITTTLFTVTSLLLVWTQSIYFFIFLRVIQGIGGGGCAVIARTSLRDVCDNKILVSAMAYISIAFHVSLGFFQFFGGIVQSYYNYKVDFVVMALLGSIIFVLVSCRFKETHFQSGKKLHLPLLIKNYWQVLREKTIIFYALSGGIGYAITLMFNILGVFYLQRKLHVSPETIGLIGIYFSAAYFLGSMILTRLIKEIEIDTLIKSGKSILLLAGGLSLLSTIIIKDSIWMIIIPLSIGIIGQAILYPCAMTKGLEGYRHMPGVSSSLFGSIQQMGGFAITILAGFLPYGSLYSISLSMILIAIISVLMGLRVTAI